VRFCTQLRHRAANCQTHATNMSMWVGCRQVRSRHCSCAVRTACLLCWHILISMWLGPLACQLLDKLKTSPWQLTCHTLKGLDVLLVRHVAGCKSDIRAVAPLGWIIQDARYDTACTQIGWFCTNEYLARINLLHRHTCRILAFVRAIV